MVCAAAYCHVHAKRNTDKKNNCTPQAPNTKQVQYCFESTLSDEKTHGVLVSSAKKSVSSLWHTHDRLKGTH